MAEENSGSWKASLARFMLKHDAEMPLFSVFGAKDIPIFTYLANSDYTVFSEGAKWVLNQRYVPFAIKLAGSKKAPKVKAAMRMLYDISPYLDQKSGNQAAFLVINYGFRSKDRVTADYAARTLERLGPMAVEPLILTCEGGYTKDISQREHARAVVLRMLGSNPNMEHKFQSWYLASSPGEFHNSMRAWLARSESFSKLLAEFLASRSNPSVSHPLSIFRVSSKMVDNLLNLMKEAITVPGSPITEVCDSNPFETLRFIAPWLLTSYDIPGTSSLFDRFLQSIDPVSLAKLFIQAEEDVLSKILVHMRSTNYPAPLLGKAALIALLESTGWVGDVSDLYRFARRYPYLVDKMLSGFGSDDPKKRKRWLDLFCPINPELKSEHVRPYFDAFFDAIHSSDSQFRTIGMNCLTALVSHIQVLDPTSICPGEPAQDLADRMIACCRNTEFLNNCVVPYVNATGSQAVFERAAFGVIARFSEEGAKTADTRAERTVAEISAEAVFSALKYLVMVSPKQLTEEQSELLVSIMFSKKERVNSNASMIWNIAHKSGDQDLEFIAHMMENNGRVSVDPDILVSMVPRVVELMRRYCLSESDPLIANFTSSFMSLNQQSRSGPQLDFNREEFLKRIRQPQKPPNGGSYQSARRVASC